MNARHKQAWAIFSPRFDLKPPASILVYCFAFLEQKPNRSFH